MTSDLAKILLPDVFIDVWGDFYWTNPNVYQKCLQWESNSRHRIAKWMLYNCNFCAISFRIPTTAKYQQIWNNQLPIETYEIMDQVTTIAGNVVDAKYKLDRVQRIFHPFTEPGKMYDNEISWMALSIEVGDDFEIGNELRSSRGHVATMYLIPPKTVNHVVGGEVLIGGRRVGGIVHDILWNCLFVPQGTRVTVSSINNGNLYIFKGFVWIPLPWLNFIDHAPTITNENLISTSIFAVNLPRGLRMSLTNSKVITALILTKVYQYPHQSKLITYDANIYRQLKIEVPDAKCKLITERILVIDDIKNKFDAIGNSVDIFFQKNYGMPIDLIYADEKCNISKERIRMQIVDDKYLPKGATFHQISMLIFPK